MKTFRSEVLLKIGRQNDKKVKTWVSVDERKFLPGFLSPLENWLWVGAAQKHRHPQRKNWDQIEPTRKHCSSNLPKVDFLKGFKRSLTMAKVLGWNGKQRNATCCECNRLSDSLQSNNKVTIKGLNSELCTFTSCCPLDKVRQHFWMQSTFYAAGHRWLKTLLFDQMSFIRKESKADSTFLQLKE